MTPSLRIITVLFVFLALLSCSSPKLEEIKGLPEKTPAAEEIKSETAAGEGSHSFDSAGRLEWDECFIQTNGTDPSSAASN